MLTNIEGGQHGGLRRHHSKSDWHLPIFPIVEEYGQNIHQRFLNIFVNVEKGWLGKLHLFKRPFRTRTPFSWRTIQMLRNSNSCKIQSPPPGSPTPTFVIITRIPQVSSIGRCLFNRPVDWSRSTSTVDRITLTAEYGRYRRSIGLHSLKNTVDIGGR